MIKNPIFKGFNPDPSICRRGDDYYVAVSSFEWLPSIPVYHSKDLQNWQLHTHVLQGSSEIDLTRLPSAKGIWAPCLTWCEEEQLFYVIYGVMNSMNARYFDVDNYLITASDITGPWSEPVYLHSAGFDASILHDDDGRKWIVSLEWETRDEYEKPGAICLAEYCPQQKAIVGYPQRIWHGGTDRGCIEAPHLTKRGRYYYLMCAEGGTGYGHCVTMGRSESVHGPYVSDPMNPILTSVTNMASERHDADHLKPKYYNPASTLQKSGHGSYVETPEGEVYLVHLCSRPFTPELRCTLGRETAIQKMYWTEDHWLRMCGDDNLAKLEVEESLLPAFPLTAPAQRDHFDAPLLDLHYYTPRISPQSFSDCLTKPGYIRIRGQESLCSLNRASLLCRKLTSVEGVVTTKMDFTPEVYQHSAGLVLYYDNMNYLYLHKKFDEQTKSTRLSILYIENGYKHKEQLLTPPLTEEEVYLRLHIQQRECFFSWSEDDIEYHQLGAVYDLSKFSDEYSEYGEFTGTFVGMACIDSMLHRKHADFDFFDYYSKDDSGPC